MEFIEKQFNVKFDWDAFFEGVKRYNKESDYMIEKWDVNCTDYPIAARRWHCTGNTRCRSPVRWTENVQVTTPR